jgi:hypothetical protein
MVRGVKNVLTIYIINDFASISCSPLGMGEERVRGHHLHKKHISIEEFTCI